MFNKNKLFYAILVALLIGVGRFFFIKPTNQVDPIEKPEETREKELSLTFAEAKSVWWNAPVILADKYDLYENHNLNMKQFDVSTGLESKNAVIQGSADVGMVASTPLVMSALKDENVVILGSYLTSSNLLSRISHIDSNYNWTEEPIGYVPGTISEFYLISYLRTCLKSPMLK